jgi:hypothetical protein
LPYGSAPARADEAAPPAEGQAPAEAAAPAEDKPTANITTDFLNMYLWRGIALSKGDSLVIEPSVTLGYKGFSVNVWGNLDTAEAKRQRVTGFGVGTGQGGAQWNETDITLAYTREIVKDLSLNVGAIYYKVIGPEAVELYGGLSYALPWFTVSALGYGEMYNQAGCWAEFDVTRNIVLPWAGMNIDTGVTLLYLDSDSKAYYPSNNPSAAFNGWESGTLNLALNIPIGKYLTISPKVSYSFPLTNDASDLIKTLSWDHKDEHVSGGIRVALAF